MENHTGFRVPCYFTGRNMGDRTAAWEEEKQEGPFRVWTLSLYGDGNRPFMGRTDYFMVFGIFENITAKGMGILYFSTTYWEAFLWHSLNIRQGHWMVK